MRFLRRAWPYLVAAALLQAVVVTSGFLTYSLPEIPTGQNGWEAQGFWLFILAAVIGTATFSLAVILGVRHGYDWLVLGACLLLVAVLPDVAGSSEGARLSAPSFSVLALQQLLAVAVVAQLGLGIGVLIRRGERGSTS